MTDRPLDSPLAVRCRPLASADISRTVQVMLELHASFAGQSSAAMYRTICADATGRGRGPGPLIAIAEEGGHTPHVIGYVVGLVDGDRYWRHFPAAHPLMAARVIAARGRRQVLRFGRWLRQAPRESAGGPAGEVAGIGELVWDPSPRVARVQHIGVSRGARGRGVAKALYRQLAEEMRKNGVVRIDAHIDAGNVASVRMHAGCGWTLRHGRRGVLATIGVE